MRTFYFEIIHRRFIIFKAIENTSCSIWALQPTNRKLMKLADGKLFRIARMKADKNFRRAVQNWLYRKFMHELQHEVIYIGKRFTCISDGSWGEHYCWGARSWSCFRYLCESRSVFGAVKKANQILEMRRGSLENWTENVIRPLCKFSHALTLSTVCTSDLISQKICWQWRCFRKGQSQNDQRFGMVSVQKNDWVG